MDSQDEVNNNNNNNINVQGGQPSSIVKGKRTKRQRPQSPIPFRMITTTPTTTNNSYKSDEGSDICSNNNVVEDITTATTPTTTMVSLSDEDDSYYRTTEEEEDMANCLILLAQGHSRHLPPHPPPLLSFVDDQHLNLKDRERERNNANNKFVSRKFMETPSSTSASGKSGYYVYECKTCGKTFSSFQALGGHRASHKKPKNKDEDYNTTNKTNVRSNNNTIFSSISNRNYYNTNMQSSDEEDPPFKVARHNNNITSSTSLSLQLTNRALWGHQNNNSNKGRVHECSICGAEFSSGQALGGHMRRHRNPQSSTAASASAAASPPMIAAVPISVQQPATSINNTTNVLSLDLDLNLPAPQEDNNNNNNNNVMVGDLKRETTKFIFESSNQTPTPNDEQQQPPPPPSPPPQPQQQQLVFSSPALVDCHY